MSVNSGQPQDTQYRFTPKFDAITVSARVSLHPKKGPLLSHAKAHQRLAPLVYFNAFSAVFGMPDWPAQAPDAENAVKLWAEDGGKRARTVLDAAAEEIARMVAFDLEQPGTANNALYKAPAGTASNHRVVPLPGANTALMVSAHQVHAENKRIWLRCATGELASFTE